MVRNNYIKFKTNEILKSFVRNDPYKIMSEFYGKRYINYRKKWLIAAKKKIAFDFPLHLDIDIQDSCDLKCPICHQRNRKRTNKKLSWKSIKKILNEGSRNNLYGINFGACGEPLLQKKLLLKSIKYASKKGIMDIFIHTNAILLDEDTSKKLLDSGLKHLLFSIDAFTKETYKNVRGSLLFDKVMSNTLRFLQLKNERNAIFPIIRVSFVVNPLNYEEKGKFLEYWNEKVDYVEFQNYVKTRSDIKLPERFSRIKRKDCTQPFRRLMIWGDGDIGICCVYKSPIFILGNIKKDKIKDVWNSPKVKKLREAFVNGKMPEICRVCSNSFFGLKKEHP